MATARFVHVVTAVGAVILSGLLLWLWPDLHKDSVTIFGTLSGCATLYGLLFAIVEVSRAKSAANLAEKAANRAADQVQIVYDIRSLSECQSCIEFALATIEKDGFVPISALSKIVKLYSAEFWLEYGDESSHQRDKISMIESYALARRQIKTTTTGNLKKALMGMMADLSASTSNKSNLERIR